MMAPGDVAALLDVLTKHGVREFADGDLKIVLFKRDEIECGLCGARLLARLLGGHRCPALASDAAPLQAPAPPENDVDPHDGCGHPLSEHDGSGQCQHGCPPRSCASKADTAPMAEDVVAVGP